MGARGGSAGARPIGNGWRGDGERLRRLPRLHRAHRILETQEPAAQLDQPRLALRSQFQPLGRAAEQDDAQHILQRADLLTHGGRRHRQFIGSAREA